MASEVKDKRAPRAKKTASQTMRKVKLKAKAIRKPMVKKEAVEAPVLNQTEQDRIRLRILELQRLKKEKTAILEEYKDTHKIEFLVPLPHQQTFFEGVREVGPVNGLGLSLLVGGNQIGKTIACVNMAGAFSLGCEAPWDKKAIFPSVAAKAANGQKVIGRILCNDWEKAARDTIVPKLKEWLPRGSYETKKNNVGVEHEFVFKRTGSRFTILTYKEDTKSHEGWTGDWVHADEPPPRDKYIANRRGLVARNGIFTMAMTAISEPWILDEIVEVPGPLTRITADIPMSANVHLSAEAIRDYENDLNDEERVARIAGGWMQLTGRVWKGFRIHPILLEGGGMLMPHVIDPFEVPPDWPVEFQIDFHLNTPHAISFCACDPYDRYYIVDEVWVNCGSEELADKIIRLKSEHGWRMKRGEIDALSKGDASYLNNRFGKVEDSFHIIERRLRKYGIVLGIGSKDEKSYIKAVETRLKGPNGTPTLLIFSNLPNTIKQVQRWSYDDNGKPKDDGHFPECIGRFTQTGLKYTAPSTERVVREGSFNPLTFGLSGGMSL